MDVVRSDGSMAAPATATVRAGSVGLYLSNWWQVHELA